MLKTYRKELDSMVHIASSFLNIDVAVFDQQSELVSCTEGYARNKGKTVHAPSIEEVMSHGNVIVNKPGHMESCKGCRFKGKCPSTIEILRSIRLDEHPIGAITFTSFSKSGHTRIINDTHTYVDALKNFSQWIADSVLSRNQKRQAVITERVLQKTIDMSNAAIIAVDPSGAVLHCNNYAEKLFSYCDLFTRSAYHILPELIVDKILEGNPAKDIRVIVNESRAFVTSVPVASDTGLDCAVIYIRTNLHSRKISSGKSKIPPSLSLDDIRGGSGVMLKLRKQAAKLANSLSTILITGDTGTGKGLFAKAIHSSSNRASAPFVAVNCTSIPETLFESELFGYEEGAFTGAKKGGKLGRFELAEGGTLFLDEIGEMPIHMQIKLLNVLQDFSFQRVGGITPVSIDVRIIAATNQNLEKLVKNGTFRTDLFYRLNVIPIALPKLKDRKEDIDLLAKVFLDDYNKKLSKNILGISKEVMLLFHEHTWPGNIRELQNVIEFSVNMEEEDVITQVSLPERFLQTVNITPPQADKLKVNVATAEYAAIVSALNRHGWTVKGKTAAANELGIGLRTLYRRLKMMDQL